MHQSGDSSHISQRLEVGRQYLETLAKIASQLENAKHGLVRSAYLTTNIEELPPGIRRLWESLDKDVMAMSAQDLATKLLQLERLLAVRLTAVMPAVEKICAAEDRGEAVKIDGVRAQLHDLSRLASTALAIRLLAHRKHYKFPPSQLPISADTLRDKAQRVKKIERVHKLRVITHMHDMVKGTVTMLSDKSLDPASKAMLRGVLRDLQANARHLGDGGSFSSMPVPIEVVEMSSEQELADELALVEDAPETKSSEHVQPIDIPKPKSEPAQAMILPAPAQPKVSSSKSSRQATTTIMAVYPAAKKRNPVLRFWRHLRAWVKAPMGVSWREAQLMMHDEDDF